MDEHACMREGERLVRTSTRTPIIGMCSAITDHARITMAAAGGPGFPWNVPRGTTLSLSAAASRARREGERERSVLISPPG